MTEQELKDGEAYQASPPGTAAALVFELERATKALEVMTYQVNQPDLLVPEIMSIIDIVRRLELIQKFFWSSQRREATS